MIKESDQRHYEGAQGALTVALWHIQQLEHAAPDLSAEIAVKQARYTICAADTVLQLAIDCYDDGKYPEEGEGDEDDDDDDDDDEGDPLPVSGGGASLDKEA